MKLSDGRREPVNLRNVLGSNVRRLRLDAGETLADFAKEAKRQGLPWAPGRVSDLESGRVDAKLDTLLALAQVLANLLDRPVTLAELLEGDPRAALFRGEPVRPDEQRDATATQVARRHGHEDEATAARELGVPEEQAVAVLLAVEDSGLVEQRAAREVGLTVLDLARRSVSLWGHNFSTERDRRAGPDAHAARLGEVTRVLRKEVQGELP